jgi:hypothetical protein
MGLIEMAWNGIQDELPIGIPSDLAIKVFGKTGARVPGEILTGF